MTQGFDEFKKYHNANYHDGDSHFDERTYQKSNGDDFDCSFVQDCYDHFEAGAASRQAEIDELQKRLAMYERQGYKLVPVEPTEKMINEFPEVFYHDTYAGECSLWVDDETIRNGYKAMIGVVE